MVISLQALDLVDPQQHTDSPHQVWDSEKFSIAALPQLDSLAKLLAEPDELTADQLDPIAANDFACGELRPPLSVAFEDQFFKVSRSADVDTTTGLKNRGINGFLTALRSLASAAKGALEHQAKFKIDRVELGDGTAKTVCHFHRSFRKEEASVEQNVVWHCQWRLGEDSAPKLTRIEVTDFEETVAHFRGDSLFRDSTESVLGANPSFRNQLCRGADHWSERIEQRYLFGPSGWQGMALGDVNGDGEDDLYLCQGGGLPNRLYIKQSDGTLADHTEESGTGWLDHSHGALLVDLDNDADLDLVLGFIDGLVVLANDGSGKFKVTATSFFPDAIPYSLSAADFDNDGDLDIYACCYSPRVAVVEHRFLARPIPYHDANNGGRNVLLRNDRRWKFSNVTRSVGLDENNRRFSLAAAWEDYDNDGDQDLYVANDFGRNNLYRNDSGKFTDVAAEAGVEDMSAGMSVAWGDYNQDGHIDLYVSNMWSSAGGRIAYQRKFHEDADAATRAGYQQHARGNSLFLNQGDQTFRDVSESSHVTHGRWAWGSAFVDINNDSREDIVVANGYITRPEDTSDL